MCKKQTKSVKTRSLISLLTCLLLLAPLATAAMAVVPMGNLETEQPILVITGAGLPGGARESVESVSNEKAYTLDELRAMEDLTVERLYSSVNRYGTQQIYRAQGIDMAGLLGLSGYTEKGRVTSVANDGYKSTADLGEDRSYYPSEGSDGDAVSAMLAWKNTGSSDESPAAPEPFASLNEEADDQALRVFVGQLNAQDVNSTFFNRNVQTLIAGDAIAGPDITVDGEEYTRADILLMPRAVHEYTYETRGGERTDTLRGTPLAVLLEDVDNDAEISFESVDGWGGISAFTMSKTELVVKNAMLTYEEMVDGVWTGYCRSTDDGFGYFRLMVDGLNGAHAVNKIIVSAGQGSAPAGDDEPDSWAQEEVDAAIEAGLVPASVADAGWKQPTTRLAAAEAIVLIIEKASGKSMDEIAEENNWDLTEGGFDDTDSLAVTFLKYAGITTGVGDNKYDPDGTYIRAMAVTMIGRAAEKFFGAEAGGTHQFTDVQYDWADPYIAYAVEQGITRGVDEEAGLFGADLLLANQMTAIFALRAYGAWK